MKELLLKDIRFYILNIPVLILFCIACFFAQFWQYPTWFLFILIEYLIMQKMNDNNDIEYSLTLPVSKKQIVKSRLIFILIIEIVFILASASGIYKILDVQNYMRIKLNEENEPLPYFICSIPLGSPNFSFYSLWLLALAIYHSTLFSLYYKSNSKPVVFHIIFLVAFILVCFSLCPLYTILYYLSIDSTFDFIIPPYLFTLAKNDRQSLLMQLPVFAGAVVLYGLSWLLTYRICLKNYTSLRA